MSVKIGDLVQLSADTIMCKSQDQVEGCGIVLSVQGPRDWAVILWNDGQTEPFHTYDLVVLSEGR